MTATTKKVMVIIRQLIGIDSSLVMRGKEIAGTHKAITKNCIPIKILGRIISENDSWETIDQSDKLILIYPGIPLESIDKVTGSTKIIDINLDSLTQESPNFGIDDKTFFQILFADNSKNLPFALKGYFTESSGLTVPTYKLRLEDNKFQKEFTPGQFFSINSIIPKEKVCILRNFPMNEYEKLHIGNKFFKTLDDKNYNIVRILILDKGIPCGVSTQSPEGVSMKYEVKILPNYIVSLFVNRANFLPWEIPHIFCPGQVYWTIGYNINQTKRILDATGKGSNLATILSPFMKMLFFNGLEEPSDLPKLEMEQLSKSDKNEQVKAGLSNLF